MRKLKQPASRARFLSPGAVMPPWRRRLLPTAASSPVLPTITRRKTAPQKLSGSGHETRPQRIQDLRPLVKKPLAHRSFEPLWQVAEKYNLPMLVHFGILGGGGGIVAGENINPLSIAEVAKGYPTCLRGAPFRLRLCPGAATALLVLRKRVCRYIGQ